MTTLAQNETRELLRYDYTTTEHLEKGKALAGAHARLASEEAHLDRIKADFKAKIAQITEEANQLLTQVQSGYELREYICFWCYDDPTPGRKTLRRKEPPQEVVREQEMSIADRQTVMESIEKQATDQQNAVAIPITKEAFAGLEFATSTEKGQQYCEGYTLDQCNENVSRVRDMLLDSEGDRRPNTDTKLEAHALMDLFGPDEMEAMDVWLQKFLGIVPGAGIALAAVQHEIQADKIRSDMKTAKAKSEKAAARKGRKTNSGTVDVPADEGTRDDVGADSKNNL